MGEESPDSSPPDIPNESAERPEKKKQKPAPGGLLNPANLVREAVQRVPELKWVLYVGAALIIYSVGASFYQTKAIVFTSAVAVIFLAGLAAVLSLAIRHSEHKAKKSRFGPGDLVLWTISVVTSAGFLLTLTSAAFGWPRSLSDIAQTMSGTGVPAAPVQRTDVEPCTEIRPCVDIVRFADFSQSKCGSNGMKEDIAFYHDTLTLIPPGPIYQGRAQPRKPAKVKVYDEGNEPPSRVSAVSPPVEAAPLMNYNINTKDGVAKILWEWTDGHLNDEDGIAFASNYIIRNISVMVRLPDGVQIEKGTERFMPAEIVGRNCVVGPAAKCAGLYATSSVQYVWKWDMWQRCKASAASAKPKVVTP